MEVRTQSVVVLSRGEGPRKWEGGIELRLTRPVGVCFWETAGVIASELGTYSSEGAWAGRGKREAVQGVAACIRANGCGTVHEEYSGGDVKGYIVSKGEGG